jgi:hypothetical protein
MSSAPGLILGTLGQPWRAYVDANGDVLDAHGAPMARWCVGIEDRWLRPSSTTRHRQVDGLPISESRIRVAGGDLVVTVFMAADAGGALIFEIANESGAPVAFGLDRTDVVSSRAPSRLPADAPFDDGCAVAVTHSTTARVAIALGSGATTSMSTAEQVARGWMTQLGRPERWELPDPLIEERLRAARANVLLAPLPDEAAMRALSLCELDVLNRLDDDAVVEVAASLERLGRNAGKTPMSTIEVVAVRSSVAMMRRHDEGRAARDAERMLGRDGPSLMALPTDATIDTSAPADARWLAYSRMLLARAHGSTIDLFGAIPTTWFGQSFSVFHVGVDGATVSAAVRWHGARPALLWEVESASATVFTVTCSGLDPTWSSTQRSGEALLAAPAGAVLGSGRKDESVDMDDVGATAVKPIGGDVAVEPTALGIEEPGSFS